MRRRSVCSTLLPAVAFALACAACGPVHGHVSSQQPSGAATATTSPTSTSSAPSPSASPSATVAQPAPSATAQAASRVLVPGMSGPAVRQLQHRLAFLKYYPGPADGQFGQDTLEAVWAFQETQGLPVQDTVSHRMQRALTAPRLPKVLARHGGSDRIEVNLRDEVLVLYHHGQVELVSHVSSGGGYYFCNPNGSCAYAITPTGDFTAESFLPGWVTVPLGAMYNPVFFIGSTYAIHGETDVPAEPVSHGCVRIPMDIAQFFHTLVTVPGTPVYIRG